MMANKYIEPSTYARGLGKLRLKGLTGEGRRTVPRNAFGTTTAFCETCDSKDRILFTIWPRRNELMISSRRRSSSVTPLRLRFKRAMLPSASLSRYMFSLIWATAVAHEVW